MRFFLFFYPLLLFSSPKLALDSSALSVVLERYSKAREYYSILIKQSPNSVSAYSSRGDANMFLGDFLGAKQDYEKMIELDPKLEIPHWRLGIAYFYLGEFQKAAHQFEIYHQYDNVDRENGIWRFMSQFQETGLGFARSKLLKYSSDDRPPYPWLYDMFKGKLKPAEVFEKIDKEGFSLEYKERVLFHANLYVGIFLELTGDFPNDALGYLAEATSNKYGVKTGTYMWHVARLHHSRLLRSIHEK